MPGIGVSHAVLSWAALKKTALELDHQNSQVEFDLQPAIFLYLHKYFGLFPVNCFVEYLLWVQLPGFVNQSSMVKVKV